MGHKVNPKVFRLGTTTNWSSKWFALGTAYAEQVKQDVRIRQYVEKKLKDAGINNIDIERSRGNISVMIYSSKPGIIIGRGGAGVEDIRKHIQVKILKNTKTKVSVDIKEVSNPSLAAMIVAKNIAAELERRIPYRRAMKRNMESVMKAGAKGAKFICAGRLNGAEIARSETIYQGTVPLQTLRADIDYAVSTARTTYGAIGIKVWIYKGDVFDNTPKTEENKEQPTNKKNK